MSQGSYSDHWFVSTPDRRLWHRIGARSIADADKALVPWPP
jgi:hypothetical protein